jgi:PRTRC genetic system protein F
VHFDGDDRPVHAGSARRPIPSRLPGSSHSWLRLPRLDSGIPVEFGGHKEPQWLEAVKSLNACKLIQPSDLRSWYSPGKVFEKAMSRWFAARTAGVEVIQLDLVFTTVSDLFDSGAIAEPMEDESEDLAIFVETGRCNPNFRSLRRGFEEMNAIADGLGLAAITILSAAGNRIGWTFDYRHVLSDTGPCTYGWDECYSDDDSDEEEDEQENEDGSNAFFSYTPRAFRKDCPRANLLNLPDIKEMQRFVLDVAKRQQVSPLLSNLVALVQACRPKNAILPSMAGSDMTSMFPVFSLAWDQAEAQYNGKQDGIYRVWDDYTNMLRGGAECWTYGLGSEVLACSTPEQLRGTLKRWDTNLKLLRATDRLLQSMTDPVVYGD